MSVRRTEENHYKEGRGIVSHTKTISPDQYGVLIRDNVVRACVDCLVVCDETGQVLLGKRCILPWQDWWTFGGRIIPGESPREACARTIKRDLGINVAPQRFEFINFASLVFEVRQEPPQENGCHDLTLFHSIYLNQEEIKSIKMERAEYAEIKWFDLRYLVEFSPDFSLHPALVRAVSFG